MKGKEHYEEAEKLIKSSRTAASPQYGSLWADQAQVHATLALTMATLVVLESADWGD